ncbi:MAG TPA: VOC family protein [Gaiellaceae bacterium]|nr:VOC family protein [Gaiellaceae bacterium]
MPSCTVIPELGYEDVGEAIEWLSDVFGFKERWRAGNHRAQLAVGDGAIALTERQPAEGSRSLMVRVDDADNHCDRARQHGARIVQVPADYPYGERQYTAEDLAGHHWTFSQTIADVAPEDWGGTSREVEH